MSDLVATANSTSKYTLLYFFASWHASHSQLSAVFQTLPTLLPGGNCNFRTVEAESNAEETEKVRGDGDGGELEMEESWRWRRARDGGELEMEESWKWREGGNGGKVEMEGRWK